jgi:hypothetical protein
LLLLKCYIVDLPKRDLVPSLFLFLQVLDRPTDQTPHVPEGDVETRDRPENRCLELVKYACQPWSSNTFAVPIFSQRTAPGISADLPPWKLQFLSRLRSHARIISFDRILLTPTTCTACELPAGTCCHSRHAPTWASMAVTALTAKHLPVTELTLTLHASKQVSFALPCIQHIPWPSKQLHDPTSRHDKSRGCQSTISSTAPLPACVRDILSLHATLRHPIHHLLQYRRETPTQLLPMDAYQVSVR